MLGFVMFLGIILLSLISKHYDDKKDEGNINAAKELVLSVESELLLASKVHDGYERKFSIPESIDNDNYSITVEDESIILVYNNIDFYGISPNMTGEIVKGENTLRNINGRICINNDNC